MLQVPRPRRPWSMALIMISTFMLCAMAFRYFDVSTILVHGQLVRSWTTTQSKRIAPEILYDLGSYLSADPNSRTPSPTNYSVLKDDYYCLRKEQYKFKDASLKSTCVNVKISNLTLNVKICPLHNVDFLVKQATLGTGDHDRMLGVLLRLLQKTPNSALIDIGANIGIFALSAIAGTRPNLKVVAVEPHPENLDSLMAGIKVNKFNLDNWAIIPRALMKTTDQSVELVSFFNTTNHRVQEASQKDFLNTLFKGPRMQVKSATLDSHVLPVVKAMNITVAIVKWDTEGTECVAIQAADKLFKEIFIPYIVMEWANLRVARKECRDALLAKMKAESYEPFGLDGTGLKSLLDIDDHMNWSDVEIVWKKIL